MGAFALESDALRVLMLPDLGAKLVSIFDKRLQHEWLIDPGTRPVQPVPYGAIFVEQDMCGWDEMFPTIKACEYPAPGRYQGCALPDHGEVWALRWKREDACPDVLAFGVCGEALPYTFSRSACLIEPDALSLRYRVRNTGDEPLACLWASHPQFSVSPETELVFPPQVTEIVNVREGGPLGRVGQRHDWPLTTSVENEPIHLNRIGPASLKTCRKFYVSPEIRIRGAALYKPESNNWLRMEWSPEQVPYVGIWVDEGAVNPEATLAIEISTGYHDSLVTAWEKRRLTILTPHESFAWNVTVRIGSGPAF
jgi:galactose mutarotase-like enzyme